MKVGTFEKSYGTLYPLAIRICDEKVTYQTITYQEKLEMWCHNSKSYTMVDLISEIDPLGGTGSSQVLDVCSKAYLMVDKLYRDKLLNATKLLFGLNFVLNTIKLFNACQSCTHNIAWEFRITLSIVVRRSMSS